MGEGIVVYGVCIELKGGWGVVEGMRIVEFGGFGGKI